MTSPFPQPILDQARALLELCRQKQVTLGTAESCTGGLVAAALTEIAGSSDVFMGGITAYSNKVKVEILGVKNSTIILFGAVSGQTSNEMAEGASRALKADVTVSVTGIAGPGGGTEEKPIGTVHFSTFARGLTEHFERHFSGDRAAIRQQAAQEALALLLNAAKSL